MSLRAPQRAVVALTLSLSVPALGLAACRRAPSSAPSIVASSPAEAVPAGAGSAAAAERPARLVVTAEPAAVAPGGTVTLLWRFEPAAGWHLYWDGRNDSGFAPRQQLRLPSGWTAGPLRWPAPARHVAAGDILDHVYDHAFTLLQDVRVPADVAPGARAVVAARWDWLACRDACVPGRDSLTVAIAVTAPAATAVPASPSAVLAAAQARLPRPLPADFAAWSWAGATCTVRRAHAVAGGRLTFMPANDCGELADLLHDGAGERLSLRTLPRDGRCGPLRGVLVSEEPGADARAYTLEIPAIAAPAAGGSPASSANPSGGHP